MGNVLNAASHSTNSACSDMDKKTMAIIRLYLKLYNLLLLPWVICIYY